MNDRTTRRFVGVMLPSVGLAAGLACGLLADVPDPLAVHWQLSGAPDGHMSGAATAALLGALIVAAGIAVAMAARAPVRRAGDLVAAVSVATFLQWTLVGIAAVIVVANDGAVSWSDAAELSIVAPLVGPLCGAVMGAIAGRLIMGIGASAPTAATPGRDGASAGEDGASARDDATPPGTDERLVWIAGATARWPLALGGALLVAGAIAVLAVDVVTGLILLLAGAATVVFTRIGVVVDQRGVRIAYGPFAWPATTVALADIESADRIDVDPMQHGGWGYRGSLRLFRRAAVVVRRGDGIDIGLADGSRLVITVDDAAVGASTLQRLLAGQG